MQEGIELSHIRFARVLEWCKINAFCVKTCRIFGVSESIYYSWWCKRESATEMENEAIYEVLTG